MRTFVVTYQIFPGCYGYETIQAKNYSDALIKAIVCAKGFRFTIDEEVE